MKSLHSLKTARFQALAAICLFMLAACQRSNPQSSAGKQPVDQQAADKAKSTMKAVESSLKSPGISGDMESVILQKIKANPDRFLDLLGKIGSTSKQDPYLLRRVDKQKGLPESYVPADLVNLDGTGLTVSRQGHKLRQPAFDSLTAMSEAARKDGVTLLVSSTYRSYVYQADLFARNVKEMGEKEAERVSARPGASQHQLGTAIDFGSITDAFADTKASAWLQKNSGAFGFSLSYPKGMEPITGYVWESWHYRYIGRDAAALQDEFFQGVQQYLILFLDSYFQAQPIQ
ncbi:MAG: M15 family metallopeptidase [Spirochaetaceae bacterium]|nr:M15 family metallopeptidase [Spirochaetaceae bacterium]